MPRQEKRLFSEALVKEGLLTKEQMETMYRQQRKTGELLVIILLRSGLVKSGALIEFFEKKLGIAYANLTNYVIDPKIVRLVPQDIARKYHLIPILKVKNILSVAMVDPLDTFVIDNLKETTGCEIKSLVSTEEEISRAINKYYDIPEKAEDDQSGSIDELRKFTEKIQGVDSSLKALGAFSTEEGTAPVIQLVNLITTKAIGDGASDIHIEPDERSLRVRFRIDGCLQEVMSLSASLSSNLISRIKVMANLDISEKRIPQDGRIKMQNLGKDYDLRVSTFPVVYGEKAVLRILDKTSTMLQLEDLGFSSYVTEKYESVIYKPNGIILLTGPTGSGKSTTLYASLDKINSIDKNIVTIEDPVEYQISMINQSQIHPKAGYDFASGLRSVLRQDPDVIMVGEIRDYETAEVAIRAALTGHLVFSTLHTNDAPGAFTRLIDMGVEPFLVASSIICSMAQRLIRTICSECKTPIRVRDDYIARVREMAQDPENPAKTLFKGKGCNRCKKTGYKGRTTINEIILPDEDIRELIVFKSASSLVKKKAREAGMISLREDGLRKVLGGISTIEEVLKVTQMDEE